MHDSPVRDAIFEKNTTIAVVAAIIVSIRAYRPHDKRIAVHGNARAAKCAFSAGKDTSRNLVVKPIDGILATGQIVPDKYAVLPDLELVEAHALRFLVDATVVVLSEDVHRLAGVAFRRISAVVDDRAVSRDGLRTRLKVRDDYIPLAVSEGCGSRGGGGTVGRAKLYL